MIDINQNDIVAVRHTADGRFVLFTATDTLPHWKQRFWAAVLDTGGDGHATLLRYGTAGAPTGWTVRQLILVVQARMAAEHARAPEAGALAVMQALAHAKGFDPAPTHSFQDGQRGTTADLEAAAVTFAPGGQRSPYPWTLARCGELELPLCPDPESREEGVTPEQLLIVVHEMLAEWAKLSLYLRPVQQARLAAKAALAVEVKRVAIARGPAGGGGPV